MNIESDVLQVENLGSIPFNDLLSLYRQGYRLAEHGENAVKLGLDVGLDILNVKGNNIRSLTTKSLATCPSSVQTGATLTLSASASSGTAPYTYHWSMVKPNGSTETLANQATNQYVVGSNGNYTVSVYVTDSCASGAKTSPTDSCVISASAGEIPTKYNCVDNVCDGPYLTGTYNSLTACRASGCESGEVQTWYCNQSTKICSLQIGSTGYATKALCDVACSGGGGGAACPGCDLDNNYCLAGNCISKKNALIAGVGVVALLVLTR